MSSKTSQISVAVGLDDERMPVDMTLSGTDFPEPQVIKAMLLSVFDADRKETLKIDLWTKDMQVQEMDRFVFQSLRAMTDTYVKATNNAALANQMAKFVAYFGEQTGIIPTEK